MIIVQFLIETNNYVIINFWKVNYYNFINVAISNSK